MMKLEILRRQVSIGSYVTLRLTRGDDVSGRIDELDDAYVRLSRDGTTGTVFEEELAGWNVHPRDVPGDVAERVVVSTPPPERDDSRMPPAGPQTADDSDPEAAPRFERVKAEFSAALQHTGLQHPEPDFQFPETEFAPALAPDLRREWDRARNQYDYALKVREIGRLNSVVAQILDPLGKRCSQSPAMRSLLGRVLLKLDRQSDAVDHLSVAASLSNTPEHWLALASAADQDTAVQCYALRRYFRLTPPSHAGDAWFRYLAVAIEHHDLKSVVRAIRQWYEERGGDPATKRVLCESGLYLLSLSKADTLAMRTAASLARGAAELPSGWEEEIGGNASSSAELLAIERRFDQRPAPNAAVASAARPIAPDDGNNGVPHGRIVSFGNQRFGFIEARQGETCYFRIDDVADERLRDALLDGSWKTFGAVEFEVRPSHGHKYNRAANVVPLQDSASLMQRARRLLRLGQPPQAMALVRRVLAADPTDQTALRLEREIKENIKKQLLPKGRGPYARAKRAQLVDLDLEQTETLLRDAIRERDKPESAIKDLAALLRQLGRAEEAIVLLEENSRRDGSYDNMLATLYEHSDRHDDAARILRRLAGAASGSKKRTLLVRLAYSQLRCVRYDEAEQVLQKILTDNPNDRTAVRLLEALQDARRAGSHDEAGEIIAGFGRLTEEGVELSSLARAAIDHCTFEGVDSAKVQARTAGARDVPRVEELAKKLGTRRPRDRAAYYLSAAALLKQDPGDSSPERVYDYLRRYFASMADASWIDKKPADVVRSYYIESLALVSDDSLDEAWRSLVRYLATFSKGEPRDIEATLPRGSVISRDKYIDALQKTLRMIEPEAEAPWVDGLLAVGAQSSFARGRLGDAFATDSGLRSTFGKLLDGSGPVADDLRETWRSRCQEHARNYRRRLSVCRTLAKYQADVSQMEQIGEQIRSATQEMRTEVDRRRLNTLGDIVASALEFCRGSDFEERERNFWLVTTQSERFRDEVVEAPTRYSHDGLLPIADHLKALIEEEYAQMDRTSGAELSLRLVVDKYVRGQEGELRLQIGVSNKSGCSPASAVRICLGPADSEYFAADQWEREVVSTLRGGHTEITQMVVRPRDAALQDRAFPINASATYRNRLGEEKRTDDRSWTVRLYDDAEFQYLKNVYAPFAEGGPVDEPDMFVGRDDLLARLESSLLSGSGSKSIVMFGQKRAGKSSLIEHLRRRLVRRGDVVPVCFSVQEIASELTVPAFFHRILQGTSEALDELRYGGRDVPDFSPPGIAVIESHPVLRFHTEMSSVVRAMERHPASLRIVLLVDEFTDIFKEIRKERIPREFMKAWKAIVEKRYFASMLVGQDVMPAFKEEFPNEFGVTEDVRVTYLDDGAATTLVEKPIGRERFAGGTVPRLLGLTANSPYYTMMFCARLVDYMNDTRSVIVTEADIRAVEDGMLRGDRRLTRDKFDNLLTAGDGVSDGGVDPAETLAVCATIARETEKEKWCARESLRGDFDDANLDALLSDLERRDVVERKGMAYRLRVGLFRDWLTLRG